MLATKRLLLPKTLLPLKHIDVILPLAIGDTYTYEVPETIEHPLPGTRVLVPLGQKEIVGIVLGDHTESLPSSLTIRPIIAVLDATPIVTPDQLRLWQWIAAYYMCPLGDVSACALPAKAQDRQYSLSARTRARLRVYTGVVCPPNELDRQQQRAYTHIYEQWATKDVVLLQGVTSSGKTEVYIHLIRDMLAQHRDVLFLVPEIALTTQLTTRLERVFGDKLLVYHSRVTDVQRMEIYHRQLVSEEGHLILGARSAVFLPLHHPGLIIIDEEHEPSYKQQEPAPRYHARSVASVLAQMTGAKCLLGTATPSLESRHNAKIGKYGYVTMPQRYQGIQLPRLTLIDLARQYHRKEMYDHFSDPLVARIREELARHKQVILFQNRRGYAPYIQCTACGHIVKCPDCDVNLTLHMQARQLVCHCCGHAEAIPSQCPECGGEMKIHGFGTERLEDEVHTLFPEARVARMDLDTTRKKDDYQHIIDRFSQHEVDILIGTQMVTKGLHFDDVSLVAVLNADQLMNQPSLGSYERAFQMLEQVAGRAGRTGAQGEVILQTFDPQNPIYNDLREHDYEHFYNHEIAEREQFHFPPFYRQITLLLKHTNPTRLEAAATFLQQRLQLTFGKRVSGVIVPSVTRIQRYHLRTINLRIEASADLSRAKRLIMAHIQTTINEPSCKGTLILPDVDPI